MPLDNVESTRLETRNPSLFIFVCVLAYTLWKTLDHLAKRAGLQTIIHKADEEGRSATAQ